MVVESPMPDPLEGLPDTARRIVDTTRRLLIEKGYSYLSIENIANECGLNKTAIRYYFRNKAGLIELVVDAWIYDNIEHIRQLFALPSEPILSSREGLRAFLRAKHEMIMDRETYLAYFELLPAMLRDRRNSGQVEELYDWAAQMYVRLFGSSLPGLSEDDMRGFAQLIIAVVDGLGTQRVISAKRFPPDTAIDLFADILVAWAASRSTQPA